MGVVSREVTGAGCSEMSCEMSGCVVTVVFRGVRVSKYRK